VCDAGIARCNFSVKAFEINSPLSAIAQPRQGMASTNNDRFLRLWFEVSMKEVGLNLHSEEEAALSCMKWFPYNKGGGFRKWYGNADYLVNFANWGKEICDYIDKTSAVSSNGRIINRKYYFKPSLSWSFISSSYFGVRVSEGGFIFDVAGSSLFLEPAQSAWLIGFLCSKTAFNFMTNLNPTLNFQVGNVADLPIAFPINPLQPVEVSTEAVNLSKTDWDNFETSWDFQTHPLLRHHHTRASDAYRDWETQSETAFQELKRLEEENNRYWIHAYGLQDELTPEVPDKEITIRRANPTRDAKSLISYAVGCMMGRYSLDAPGLIHAGQAFDPSRHGTFPADLDGIIPITDEAYFDDDAASRFTVFLKTAFGPEHLQENLEWIADALERKRDETPSARIRRYFLTEFVSDHIQTYKKRPIYWVFTSGKKRAFNAIVYLHRYQPDSLARMRTDYVLELQTKLEATLERLGSSREAPKVREQIAELRAFQERLQHKADQRIALDLDDGVAFNYTLFQGLVYEGNDLKMADLLKRSQWKRDLLAGKVRKGPSKTGSEEDSDLEAESE
jgi:hypothetical protein